ncbi:MAG: GntR family transcriptional regulator [Firmicutes bacterium]|nr:GntR family transcriptional regulator [Bacillota bacterium]
MKQLDFSKEALPLYIQLRNIIKEDIENEVYKNGDFIPAEIDFQNQYNVSRITVRQAILSLEKDGYVRRARGKGTSIIYSKKIEEKLTRIRSFTDEMKDRGIEPGTSYIHIQKEAVGKDLQEIFQTEAKELVCLKRVRTGNRKPIVYFVSYFNEHMPMPLEKEAYNQSIYELFEKLEIHKPVRVVEHFKADISNEEISKMLEIEQGSPLLIRIRTSYNKEQEVIEHTISYYRADSYSYSIEISE